MAEQDRPPVFELHIRPMFRLLDRDHMLPLKTSSGEPFDLWDLERVWEERDAILTKVYVIGDMPPRDDGGPWPDEWIGLFQRWVATGSDSEPGHHLVKGTPNGDYLVEPLGDGVWELSVRVTAPTRGCRVWFELESVGPGQRQYTLYLEPAYPKQEPRPTLMEAVEDFAKGDASVLIINDQGGRHEITIP
jgi:hypothetical protein